MLNVKLVSLRQAAAGSIQSLPLTSHCRSRYHSNLFDLFESQLDLNSDGLLRPEKKNIIPRSLNPKCPPIRKEMVSSAVP